MEIKILRVRGSLGERGEGRGEGGGGVKLVRCDGRDEENRTLSVYVYVCGWVYCRSEAKRSEAQTDSFRNVDEWSTSLYYIVLYTHCLLSFLPLLPCK